MEEKTTNTCRICLLEIVETEQYYFLNNDNELMLQSKLLDFLPEIDLNITSNPIACNSDVRYWYIYEGSDDFLKKSLQTRLITKRQRHRNGHGQGTTDYENGLLRRAVRREPSIEGEDTGAEQGPRRSNEDASRPVKDAK
ncbi:hypothetical protein RN001_015347, partial [Aquatica leii]